MPVTIRLLRDDDLPRVTAITVEGFDGVSIDRNIEDLAGPIQGKDWRWRKARTIEADIRRDPQGAFVAEWEGEVVGYITTWTDLDAGVGHIPNLAVDAAHRGQKIGRRLIQQALDHFRARGASYARIETLQQNPVGQALYPSLGFQEIARQIHYGMKLD